jgi:hypothetical protein
VKCRTKVARAIVEADAGLGRLTRLEKQLAFAPVNSRQYRTVSALIRIEADAYRKSLDTEQATATHDADSRLAVRVFSNAQTLVSDCRMLVRRPRARRGHP